MGGEGWQTLLNFLQILLYISAVAGVAAIIVLIWTYQDIRRLNIPAGAGFFETLRIVPLRVAIFMDLLDLALDTFAAPVAWLVLRWLKLDQLRAPALVEALIPGTQLIPTMTLLWVATRALNLGELPASVSDPWPAAGGSQGTVIEGRVIRE